MIKLIVYVLMLLAFLLGCSNSPTAERSGEIHGFAFLTDINGNRILNDTGITVIIIGGEYVATVKTDSNGYWQTSEVPQGTYSIEIFKTRFASHRFIAYQFVGTGHAYVGTVILSPSPSLTAQSLNDSIQGKTVYFSGTLSDSLAIGQNYQDVIIFLSAIPHVDATYSYLGTIICSTDNRVFSTSISLAALEKFGFKSGQNVYAVAYGIGPNPIGYLDPMTGKDVYTGINLSSSNTLNFFVP